MASLNELITQKLKDNFGNVDFEFSEFRDELTISFDKKNIVEVCRFLKG